MKQWAKRRYAMAYVPGVILSHGARLLKYFLSGEREEFSAFVGSWEADAFDAMRFLQNIMPGLLRWKFSQHATLIQEMNQVYSSNG
ncbi:uncharacterized protein EAE97_010900 [Botrytis byssoidea]|uniref:Uncharacterized protein n=1 Tax=Botrytis byssoidea TaxID=139641 RepID=A0A9P5LV19_9HELO|nr:uncharacterized protein EAE97_010900 [Botrytis byssoidea]KAF7923462.1 hypothetical protein EAE97_010900 [Botrytis byssoidea]